jgi:hypothetical protein
VVRRVCSRNLVIEEELAYWGLLCQKKRFKGRRLRMWAEVVVNLAYSENQHNAPAMKCLFLQRPGTSYYLSKL